MDDLDFLDEPFSSDSEESDGDADSLMGIDSDSTHFSDAESSSDDEDDNLEDLVGLQTDWNQEFRDDAMEFEPHAMDSEIMLQPGSSPMDILQQFITDEMVNIICVESNRYAQQKKIPGFVPITSNDFWRFLALNLSMGLVKKSAIGDYWAVKTLIPTPYFNSVMTRDRYRQILRSLHFVDNTQIPANNPNRFAKLGTFMEDLFRNIRSVINPGEFLCIDESFVPFKGRLSIKQYNPKKRARFGVLLYKLADCTTKMIIDILLYQGKATKLKNKELQKSLGFGGAAVLTLLDSHFNKGHRVVTDNYFNSPALARVLKQKRTYMLGTVQKRRKGMPKSSRMTRKLKKGQLETFSDGDIIIERWCDRRDVCMINTFMPHSMNIVNCANPNNTREKPGSVVLYNAKMGVIDDSDKVTAPLKTTRKSYKWYRKVAFHLMDIAVYNTFLAYKILQSTPTLKYKVFIENLIEQILAKHPRIDFVKRGRPSLHRDEDRLSGQHYPEKVLKPNGKSSKSDCFYCKTVEKKRKSTVFGCKQCKKRLCIRESPSCFELYHTQTTLRKRRDNSGSASSSEPTCSTTFAPAMFSTPVTRQQAGSYSGDMLNETTSSGFSVSLLD